MKTKTFFANLLLASLFIAAPVFADNPTLPTDPTTSEPVNERGDVTNERVVEYLRQFGYIVTSIRYAGDGYDRYVRTQYDDRAVYVYVEGGDVVGHCDINL